VTSCAKGRHLNFGVDSQINNVKTFGGIELVLVMWATPRGLF